MSEPITPAELHAISWLRNALNLIRAEWGSAYWWEHSLEANDLQKAVDAVKDQLDSHATALAAVQATAKANQQDADEIEEIDQLLANAGAPRDIANHTVTSPLEKVKWMRDELATARRELAACRFTPLLNLHPGVTIRANELIAACRAVGIRILGDAVADDGMESDARLTAARAEAGRLRKTLTEIHAFADGCMEGAGEPEFSNYVSIGNTALQALAPRETGEGGK